MKKGLLYIFLVAIVCFVGCGRDEESHISVPKVDKDDKGGAVVALDVQGVEASKIKDTHIYGFDAQQKIVCHYYYPTPQQLSLDMLQLNGGTFTFVAVLNVGEDFVPVLSKSSTSHSKATDMALPQTSLSGMISYLIQVEGKYPDMMTGMISRQINLGEVTRLDIVIRDKVAGLSASKVQLTLILPGAEFPTYQDYRTRSTTGYELHAMVEAYSEGSDKLVSQQVVTLTTDKEGNYTCEVILPEGMYNLLVWADYTATGTTTSLFYNTASLRAVTFTDPYTAGTEAREAFYQKDLVQVDQGGELNAKTIRLERPQAKYRLVTSDIARYRSLISTNDYPPLEELSITVQYEGFFPCGFDVSTGKPNDSKTGYTYTATLPAITEQMTEVEVANDYVFVNGTESAVTVTVLVRDKTGKVISRVQGVEVKYKRGMLTTVTGDFLTAGVVNPGINIDTNWDGEYEVTF